MSGTARILKNAAVLHAGYDISGQISSTTFTLTREILDATTVDVDHKINKTGLGDTVVALSGFFAAGSNKIDDQFDATEYPAIVSVLSGQDVGAVAYHIDAIKSEYEINLSQGQLIPFNFSAQGTGTAGRGKLVSTGTLTTGNSAIINLGPIVESDKIWIVAQIASVGTSIDIELWEDTTSDFSDDPQLVATMNQITSAGAYFLKTSGPITGPYYRLQYTVSGSTTGKLFIARGN